MSETHETDSRLVAGLWQVVAAHGWPGLSMRRVADASGIPRGRDPPPLPEPLRPAGAARRGGGPGGAGRHRPRRPVDTNTPRDRVFDVLMRRIDALQPHRAGILRLFEDLKQDPLLALLLLARLPKSMAWMLEAAGLGSGGLAGLARAKGLTAVWLATLRAWKDDETADLGPTMAALDRALDRAEQVARSLRLARGTTAA